MKKGARVEKILPGLAMVIVSPLHHALETAWLMFKFHPNFDKITFMLDPNLRECLDSPDCIPNSIHDLLKEFKPKFKNLDTSLLHLKDLRSPDLWFLENSTRDDRHAYKREIRNERKTKY